MASKKTIDLTRREVVQMGVVAAATGPFLQTVKAANDQIQLGIIGTGGRGQYHITHLNKLDGHKLVAACDIYEPNLKKAVADSKDKPQGYKDYRELLSRKDVDAVMIAAPLYMHYPMTRDAILAGKHVFCEKSLVFKPEEAMALRALMKEHSRQVLQVGLQRRYSQFYQVARQMIEKGLLGDVTNVYAQWHRNLVAKPSKNWIMKKNDPRGDDANWRLLKRLSGGLTAELASHQIDIADWMFGSHPEMVMGLGGVDYFKDGRDNYDNIQLIFRYPKGQRLMYSSIGTNSHSPMFNASRTEFGEIIMGTKGTIHITVGTDDEPALGLWFREPEKPAEAGAGAKPVVAAPSLASTGKGSKAIPVLLGKDEVTERDSFLSKEMKFARRWLYSKGVMVPEEDKNPVDTQLESFFDCCRNGGKPKADIEVGLADSSAVMLSNLAMDEGRRVYFSEFEKLAAAKKA